MKQDGPYAAIVNRLTAELLENEPKRKVRGVGHTGRVRWDAPGTSVSAERLKREIERDLNKPGSFGPDERTFPKELRGRKHGWEDYAMAVLCMTMGDMEHVTPVLQRSRCGNALRVTTDTPLYRVTVFRHKLPLSESERKKFPYPEPMIALYCEFREEGTDKWFPSFKKIFAPIKGGVRMLQPDDYKRLLARARGEA